MVQDRGQPDIIDAIPGGRAALRWYGWSGVALMVVPALALAALAVNEDLLGGLAHARVLLSIVGLASLAAAAVLVVLVLGSLRRLGELAQLLCEHNEEPVFVKDTAHRYRFANDAAAALLGLRAVDLAGRRDADLRPGGASLAFEENDRVCLERDLPTLFRETQPMPDGSERSLLVSKRPLHDGRGRVAGLVGTARDITDEIELQKLTRRRAEETRAFFEHNPLPAVMFANADQRILEANLAAEQCYGYPRTRLRQMQVGDLFSPEEADRLHAYLRGGGHAVPPGSVAWRQRRATGERFETLADIGNLPHAKIPARVMLVRDVSAERAATQSLAECASRYDDLVESGIAMVWMHDMQGRLLRVNTAMAQALGYGREDLVGRMLADFVPPEGHADWTDYLERVGGLKRDAGVLHLATRNGERRVWQYQFVCYPDAEPAPYVLGAAQDVTLRHRYELRLRDQTQRDALTGCRTRRFLEAFSLQAAHDQAWGCVVVDIDYFHQLNASEGRARGDEVLRDLARLLVNTAGSADIVVRMGGDEFAVIMPNAGVNAVRELAERLAVPSRDGMPAVFSIGWAVRQDDEPIESTLRRADKMLLRGRRHEQGSV